MKKYFFIAAALLTMLSLTQQSCKSKAKESDSAAQTAATTVLQVDEVLTQAPELTGQNIEVEGICTHICAHGGGKIFLMGSDDTQNIRIEAGQEVGKFKAETVNSVVRVKGKLIEERIDEAYLTQWEEKLKAETAENHGESEAGCASEQKARGEATSNTAEQRIENFRKRIAERKEKEGKEYLSFYHVEAEGYEIL